MELRQLKAFHTLTKVHSFTKAAEILGYTQSSITTQIKLLEEELGTRLFDRLGRQVILTCDGQFFLHYAEQILQLSEEAKYAFYNEAPIRGAISIGAGESLCSIKLPNLLKEYCKRYPQIELTVKTGTGSELKSWLKTNVIDIAFLLSRDSHYPNLAIQTSIDEPTILVSEPTHSLTRLSSVTPEDLSNQTLILSDKGCGYRTSVENIIAEKNIFPASILEFSSIAVMKQFVGSGLGIAFLPLFSVTSELASGKLVELKWDGASFGMSTQIVYHKNKWLSPSLTAFLELTKTFL